MPPLRTRRLLGVTVIADHVSEHDREQPNPLI
jgi:hypothetical protein